MMLADLGKRPLVMGILNVTPDSFSGDGLMAQSGDFIRAALDRGARIMKDGADILDVGGESSRPGHAPVTAAEEMCRAVPVVAALKKEFPGTPIAIDTIKAEVAAAACEAGASIINDVSALGDPAMAKMAAGKGAYLVLMHNRGDGHAVAHDGKIGGEYKAPAYDDVVDDVGAALAASAASARAAGVAADRIILDPGLGFGKSVAQNLALINRLEKLKALGYPVLIGPSRKSFIGRVLDLPVEERLEGTAALVAIGVLRGADIVRVHDVKEMVRVAKMVAAIRAV